MTAASAMPELPEPEYLHEDGHDEYGYATYGRAYTADQMNARYLRGYNDALSTLQAPWQSLDLDAVCGAFRDVIEAHHARKNPFHNPLNHRAMIALRELESIIPYMKAIGHITAPAGEEK